MINDFDKINPMIKQPDNLKVYCRIKKCPKLADLVTMKGLVYCIDCLPPKDSEIAEWIKIMGAVK